MNKCLEVDRNEYSRHVFQNYMTPGSELNFSYKKKLYDIFKEYIEKNKVFFYFLIQKAF